jgi:hypothetical protein
MEERARGVAGLSSPRRVDVNESTRGKKSFFSVYNIANVTR